MVTNEDTTLTLKLKVFTIFRFLLSKNQEKTIAKEIAEKLEIVNYM
jgi:hypothetical protein